MKKFTLLLFVVFAVINLLAQNSPPVAVDDTIVDIVYPYQNVTLYPLENDFDPDGDSFRIYSANILGYPNPDIEFTDSTISFNIDGNLYYSFNGPFLINYILTDDISPLDTISKGRIYLHMDNLALKNLDINNIDAMFSAFGNHFWDFQEFSHYNFPKDSTTQSIFANTFWIGGLDENNNLHLAAERYRQVGKDYWTGPLSFNADSAWIPEEVKNEYFKIWKLNKAEIEYHVLHYNDAGYEPIEPIATWPAQGDTEIGQAEYLAPFMDMNNDGDYNPMDGDYPLIRGDQSLFFIFNDQLVYHTESQGLPLGVEIHGFAYAFSRPEEPWLNNTTFLSYKIFNRSPNTYSDVYAGVFTDIDLGDAYDDYVGCDVSRGAYYCYNSDSIDGSGQPQAYGDHPPAQGVVILGGPYMDPDGMDNPSGGCNESINGVGFGDGEADNERYGMNQFIYFNNGGPDYASDPNSSTAYYNFMKGIWNDLTIMQYGGNGHPSAGAYGPEARFMFPGLSDPCNWGTGGVPPNGPVEWTEITAGNEGADRRGMASMGPFTLEPGGFHKVDLAFVSAIGEDYLNSVDVLMNHIDLVREAYYADPDYFGYDWLGTDENTISNQTVKIFPNPVNSNALVEFTPTTPNAGYIVLDTYGRVVKSGRLTHTKYQQMDLTGLNQGLYVLRITDGSQQVSLKIMKK